MSLHGGDVIMKMLAAIFLTATLAGAPKDHQANPLFRELIKDGLGVGAKAKVLLPAPTMADGLDAAGQKKVLDKLIEGTYEFDNFVGNSPVAPNILRTRDIEPSDPQSPAKGADFWFVAYGDWKKVTDKEFMQKAWNASPREPKVKLLSAAELAKRSITIPADQTNQLSFGYGSVQLFNKVEVSGTGYSYWTKTESSFVLAGKLDPRFLK